MAIQHLSEIIVSSVCLKLKSGTRNYALGYLWWLIEPVLHLLVLFIVFGIFFGQSGEAHYIPFLLCGLVPWIWFHKSVMNGLVAIVDGRSIIMDVHVPKIFFPTVSILQDLVKELVVFACFLFALFIAGVAPGMTWLWLPLIMLLQFLLIAVVAALLAIALPYFFDLKQILPTLLQVVMFGSGTFYDYRQMPEVFQDLLLLNPMALLIGMYRDVLIYGEAIAVADCAYILSIVCVLGLINFALYQALDKDVPRVLFR
jgi:lipopolysaccharide transport system permease protein